MIEERYTLADIEGRTYDEDFKINDLTDNGVSPVVMIERYIFIITKNRDSAAARAAEFLKECQPGDRVVFYVNDHGTGCVLARGQRIVSDLKICQKL